MRYDIILTKEAKEDLNSLEPFQREKLLSDYSVIQIESINAVNTRPLGNKLFEIKTDNLRSLYMYRKDKIIIIIGVIFIKKTQKTPKQYMEKAIKFITRYKD